MTGMSSLIGYTRRQVAHFRPEPSPTRVTAVLQFGQTRISSNSGATGMRRLYDIPGFCGPIRRMKIVVLVAVLGASAPLVEAAQARRPAAPPPAQAPDRLAQAYDQFLRAHMLEEEDVDGAIAAYRRAMTLD